MWEEGGGRTRNDFMHTMQEVHEILIDFLSTCLQKELKIRAVKTSSSVEIISRDLDKKFGHAFK
jgi:hypothetical protein